MKKETFCEVLGDISEKYIREARADRAAKKAVWLRWGTVAACLCVMAAALLIPAALRRPAETPYDTADPGDGPSSLVVNGTTYLISSYLAVSSDLPDGFSLAGETDVGGFENCSYYVNPDVPEWVYVYQEDLTDGSVDSTGTLTRTEPHNAYVRYVDQRLRGKDLVFCGGSYYISMWSAHDYGETPDVSREYYNVMESAYGVRLEGAAPDGFVSAGTAEFSGYDTVPRGALSSNQGAHEVFVNPNEPDVILVPTQWYTAASGETGETRHEGFDVYIRYDCPLA